ncbi:protein kinase [Rudanella paleaurantiibacter]|uniref:Protein kinase n=1 Tax=Rudanella paleaurantiibacter TaxID=2614655 RepID=A0A7J5U5W3_9BACT|nr:serine/threonine-protein kinase [Rudanella paleaurantiibacter]KAB7733073.1 protein kinase [Rudanella paleaurantiibacter]
MSTVNFNTHLPGYEVLAELGRGNTRVLKARHTATGEVVAIKQYAFPADPDTLRRFERESVIMTQLNHPNVVRVREVQLTAAMPYVVMDYVEGGDVRGLLRQQGPLPIPMVIRLGLQLTEAFRAVHPLRVVHRDLKPENILYRKLVSGELHVLLTDFGIAKFWSDDNARTRTGQSMMTCEYAAPEQFDNPRQIDEAADYYALGVVLYECLTGQVPFRLEHETGLAYFMQQVLTAPIPAPVRPSGEPIPLRLQNLLMRLLERNPQERLRNPDELELALEQSRVEHLQANWSAKEPAGYGPKTRIGPTVQRLPDAVVPVDEPRTSPWAWWGIGGGVAAAALALFLYTRPADGNAQNQTLPTDSTAVVAVDSTLGEPESNAISPDTATEGEGDTERENEAGPLATETTSEEIPQEQTAVPDSVGEAAPDTTQN